MSYKIAPSLMCADLLRLEAQIRDLERAAVDYLHIDVMDGHFVPNLALSLDLVRQIKASTRLPLDVHLMVENPESYVHNLASIGVRRVSFHLEATANPIRLLRALRNEKTQVGIAVNPSTPPEMLTYLLDELDYVLVMTVEPGFAGQEFIPEMVCKIQCVRRMLVARNRDAEIEVDGNMDAKWASQCIDSGASIVVAGTSSVFQGQKDVYTACMELRRQIDMHQVKQGNRQLVGHSCQEAHFERE